MKASEGPLRRTAIALVWAVVLVPACGARGCHESKHDATLVAERDGGTDGAAAESPPRAIQHIGYGDDGTLVIEMHGRLVGYSPSGVKQDLAIARDASVTWPYPRGSAVLVQDGEIARLVALGPLREVHASTGRAFGDVIVEGNGENDTAVVLLAPGATKISRLAAPAGKKRRVDNVTVTKSGRFAVVSWVDEVASRTDAFAHDLATGRTIGPVMKMSSPGAAPSTTFDGDRQVGFRGDRLVVLDLATGGTLRQAPIACPKPPAGQEVSRANPIVDPRGRRIIVTCNEDGIVLDARTLAPLRTMPRIIPGCDNGDFLPARFSEDGLQLVVEGCGGEARVDVQTGRYVCGDGTQLMGAPYEPVGPQSPPPRSIGVPPCRDAGPGAWGGSDVSLSAHYRAESNASGVELVGPGNVRLPLSTTGAIAGDVAVSAKEDRFATIDEAKVVVRSLPAGTVLTELRP